MSRLYKKNRVARRLFTSWKGRTYAKQACYDLNLFFSIKNTEIVYSQLIPEEKKDLKCIFTAELGTRPKWRRLFLGLTCVLIDILGCDVVEWKLCFWSLLSRGSLIIILFSFQIEIHQLVWTVMPRLLLHEVLQRFQKQRKDLRQQLDAVIPDLSIPVANANEGSSSTEEVEDYVELLIGFLYSSILLK